MADINVRFVCTMDSFKPAADDLNIRWLEWTNEDFMLMKELKATFGVNFNLEHWKDAENFGFKFAAYVLDGRIVSLAGAIRWSETSKSWEVGAVQTREDARSKGYSKKVVSYVTQYILDSGKFATCNTGENNIAMQKTALSVGFFRQDE